MWGNGGPERDKRKKKQNETQAHYSNIIAILQSPYMNSY